MGKRFLLPASGTLPACIIWVAISAFPPLSCGTNTALAQENAVLKAYACPPGTVQAVANRLKAEFGSAGARVAVDERTSQLIVFAPPQIQVQISQRLQRPARPISQTRPPVTPPAGQAVDAPPTAAVNRHLAVALQHCAAEQLAAAMESVLTERIVVLPHVQPHTMRYRITFAKDENVDLTIDAPLRRVIIEGPASAVESCARLIRAIDNSARRDGPAARFISLRTDKPAGVLRAVALINSATGDRRLPAMQTSAANQRQNPADDRSLADNGSKAPGGRRADTSTRRVGLVSPVQIEAIDGLNVLVLRGKTQDVDELIKIIHEIEQLSAETTPAVELITLRQAGCVALGELLRSVYDEIYLPRQGNVSITPLVAPNALLLVGRRENVRTVAELVAKLDQPLAPDAQFRVFPLRYAAAAAAERTIADFYAPRGGLGPQIRVTADVRGNAILAQAAPRDMNELAALIAKIDAPTSAAVNELRVIQLQHSLAADLAEIVKAAIGSATGSGRAPNQATASRAPQEQTSPQANRQPSAQNPRVQNEQRSAMLRFLSIDAQGRRLVESGILAGVQVTPDVRANAVIISAPSESIDLIEALIHQLDALPAAEAQIKVFTIVNGDAEGLKDMLETLFASQAAAGARSSRGGPASAPAGTEAALVPLRFAIDPRTNSIIASGTMADLGVVEAILLRLDDGNVRQRKSVVFRLKNSPADSVAAAVREFLSTERDMQERAPGMTSAFEQIEREVTVVPEMVSNSLILSATPRFFEEVKELIEQLDKRPPMVMIQVLIAQIKMGNTDEFGVELGLQDSLLFDRSLLSNPLWQTTTVQTPSQVVQTTETLIAANNEPGINFNNGDPLGNSGAASATDRASLVGGQGLSNFGVGRTSEMGYGGLVLSASSESVSVLIRALSECNRLEVLQRPQIMTLDNQPAYIQVGEQVPIVKSTSLTNYGQNFLTEMINVGVVLGVTPRISPDGLVVMEIDAQKSHVGAESEGTPIAVSEGQIIRSPRIDIILAQTTVSATSGQTVILGGLITKQTEEFHRKVPCLGDIPVLGRLFRYDGVKTGRTELLFVMTPYIISDECEADAIKQAEAAKMSWCMCDVVEIHGDVGMRCRSDEWSDAETQVIYPDMELAPCPEGLEESSGAVPEMIPVPQGVHLNRWGGEADQPHTGARPVTYQHPLNESQSATIQRR